MKIDEIVEQTKLYFGKNRKHLKKKVLAFKFDGTEAKLWKKRLRELTSQPVSVEYGIFDEVVDGLTDNETQKKINWHWLGDLSWTLRILLTKGVYKGLDWDKKLASKCGGTARILEVYVSDIVPCFAIDTYYMTYNKKENFYEFGPLIMVTDDERKIINKTKRFLRKLEFNFISKKNALKQYEELYSDTNSEGNASLFSSLFSDTDDYQTEFKRFNDKELKDPTGKTLNWNEYYNRNQKLIRREEFRYYPSKNVECVITDSKGQIIEVKIWRNIGRRTHHEFKLDILKEFREKKKIK